MTNTWIIAEMDHMPHGSCQQLEYRVEFGDDPLDVENVSDSAIWRQYGANHGQLGSTGFYVADGTAIDGYQEIHAALGRSFFRATAFVGVWGPQNGASCEELCGPEIDCDDADPCTDDACAPGVGCTHPHNTASCDDGDACTVGDTCAEGVCAAGGTASCDDGDPCTDDACHPAGGCSHTLSADIVSWYADADDDGFGDPSSSVLSCTQPPGYVDNALDCNDLDGHFQPGGFDGDCDARDQNCNGVNDEEFHPPTTSCGIGACASSGDLVCLDGATVDTCVASAPTPETCDGVDNDCDGGIDEDAYLHFYPDVDGDGFGDTLGGIAACSPPPGYVPTPGDCDDHNPGAHPGAPEVCNGRDDDCNGGVDDQAIDMRPYWPDLDDDGWGGPASVLACVRPPDYVDTSGDCDDGDAATWPGAPQTCDEEDRDCDGQWSVVVPDVCPTIQSGIDAAPEPGLVHVSAGTYFENIDFTGKDVQVVGEGREVTVIDGHALG